MSTTCEELAMQLGQQLKAKGWKLVTAESCTGGGLAYCITSISGSSSWFERGFVTYSNVAKEELLGIHPQVLEKFGAVSEQTALEMAEGALHQSHAQLSLAITGIAGPDGGTTEKPVGTVWIAYAGIQVPTTGTHYLFIGNRETIREQAINHALVTLLDLST
jgi:nicotinamide-nucleotide amidase